MNADRNKYKDLLVIVVGFSIIGIIVRANLEVRGHDPKYGEYVIYGAIILGVLGIISERLTELLTKGWEMFGKTLGKISSSILLSTLFILMLTPLALLQRLTTKRKDINSASNWTDSSEEEVNFEKLW